MVGAPASIKTFYGAKHALGAFITLKTTNVISLIIIPISPTQIYRLLTQSHPTIRQTLGTTYSPLNLIIYVWENQGSKRTCSIIKARW
jgi:hypothetical protein